MNIQDRICNRKIKGGCASICWKCIHFYVCFAKESQPCVECNQYISAEPQKKDDNGRD